MTDDEKLYTTDDVCDLYGVTRRSVYRWRRAGKLQGRKVGRRVYYTKDEVYSLLEGGEYRPMSDNSQ